MPAFTTTARMAERSSPRLYWTGADGSALVVSTSPDTAGPSATRMPRSSAPEGFRPHATPEARKPGVDVTEPPSICSAPAAEGQPVSAQDRLQRRPSVSGRPAIRLRFWTAWPAAPLPMLSITPKQVTRPLRGSGTGHTWA